MLCIPLCRKLAALLHGQLTNKENALLTVLEARRLKSGGKGLGSVRGVLRVVDQHLLVLSSHYSKNTEVPALQQGSILKWSLYIPYTSLQMPSPCWGGGRQDFSLMHPERMQTCSSQGWVKMLWVLKESQTSDHIQHQTLFQSLEGFFLCLGRDILCVFLSYIPGSATATERWAYEDFLEDRTLHGLFTKTRRSLNPPKKSSILYILRK